jgi:hypothetical protein
MYLTHHERVAYLSNLNSMLDRSLITANEFMLEAVSVFGDVPAEVILQGLRYYNVPMFVRMLFQAELKRSELEMADTSTPHTFYLPKIGPDIGPRMIRIELSPVKPWAGMVGDAYSLYDIDFKATISSPTDELAGGFMHGNAYDVYAHGEMEVVIAGAEDAHGPTPEDERNSPLHAAVVACVRSAILTECIVRGLV